MISLIIGHPGEGKSLYQTMLLKKAINRNPERPVFANYEIKIKEKVRYYILYYIPIPFVIYDFFTIRYPSFAFRLRFSYIRVSNDNVYQFKDLEELYNVNNAIICIDEMATLFSNRDWKNTPAWFLQKLAVHRHEGIDIIGTTQRYDGIDNIIRELSFYVFWVRKINLIFMKVFKISRVKYHPVLGTPDISFYDLIFPTKRDYSLYNSWSNDAINTNAGNKLSYKPTKPTMAGLSSL